MAQESGQEKAVAVAPDPVDIANRMVAQFRELSRHRFERFETEWAAADEVRVAELEMTRLMFELRRQDAETWTRLIKEFGTYAFECEQARLEKGAKRIALKAESARARTTDEDIRKADEKLQAAMKNLPLGEGPAYDAMVAYHAKRNACGDLSDRFNAESQALTEKLTEVRRQWFGMDDHLWRKLEKVTEPWHQELIRLQAEAENAKRAEADKSDAAWPEEKRWPAARRRYVEYLEREIDWSDALKR
ncbi:hypothetical protein [Luteolibacter flavescens]|nr:hypothetical protein [Luteolibacter flavescens]